LSTAEIEAYATEYNLTATQLESLESLTDQSTVTEEDISEILGSSASESTISAIESLLASYTSASVYSSNADDKTLHELYMWPWADAVRAGAGAVMCSMNLVNGTHACENEDLMAGKLKTELGFPGFVFPDANAQTTAYASANAGLDYSTLGYWTQETLSAGIANGSITAERLEDMAIRTVLPYFLVGLDTSDLPSQGSYTSWRDVRGDHDVLIRQVGGEAISLLKNNIENGKSFPSPRSKECTESFNECLRSHVP
jgi:beta-glucosidase